MAAELALDGCRVEPLGAYLKGLGVFRLLAEQFDPAATARWVSDRLVVGTAGGLDELVELFVDRYQPTPIVSPWNGGSGFYPKDNQDGIAAIERSVDDRLHTYRQAIGLGRKLVAAERWGSRDKAQQVDWCRQVFPDETVAWLDAAVVLTGDKAVFPPLLGTGGNVGRLELSNNFMQRLVDVLALGDGRSAAGREDSIGWLRASLSGSGGVRLRKVAVGQFDPGAAGGTNAPAGGPEDNVVNPWDFVLMFEGALLFASGAARRGDSGAPTSAMPFTFESSPVGYPSAAPDETIKGELWMPAWSRPWTLPETKRVFREGRVDWRGQHARRGVDVARAAASLGVDRGIDSFARYALVERLGQAYLAVPAGRLATAGRQRPEVPVVGDLDGWLDQVRRAPNMPVSTATALRRVDAAMIALAGQSGTDWGSRATALQDVLIAAAELEGTVARSGSMRASGIRPVATPVWPGERAEQPLTARRWLRFLDDGSPEFRLAVALASGRDPGAMWTAARDKRDRPAVSLRGIELSDRNRWGWRADGRPLVAGLGSRYLVPVLVDFVLRRSVDVAGRDKLARASATGDPEGDGGSQEGAPDRAGQVGVQSAFAYRRPVSSELVALYLHGGVDEVRLGRLLSALLLLNFAGAYQNLEPSDPLQAPAVSPAAALILPFFHGRALWAGGSRRGAPGRERLSRGAADVDGGHLGPDDQQGEPDGERQPDAAGSVSTLLRPASSWPRLLAADRVDDVVRDALHRLRVAGLEPLVGDVKALASGVDGARLLAATAFPLTPSGARSLLRRVARPAAELDEVPDDDVRPQDEMTTS